MAALDISKAFDKVNHYILFSNLLDRRVPLCIIKVLICWYGTCNAVVRRQNSLSCIFAINAGVQQGGVLSPLLFFVGYIYMNNLIDKLDVCGFGSRVHCLLDAYCMLTVSYTHLTLPTNREV